jgi:hypothetical protein
MTDSNTILMTAIKSGWGSAINNVFRSGGVPDAFLAALIANESGGRNDAKRFEPRVLVEIWEVLLGRKASFGSIGRADLVAYVSGFPATAINPPAALPADAFQRADALASSWGLTQIMGYHILDGQTFRSLDDLKIPERHLFQTLRILGEFAAEFKLDLTQDFEKLFRCWNTGKPDGKTFDPMYASNGLVRMAVWSSLP